MRPAWTGSSPAGRGSPPGGGGWPGTIRRVTGRSCRYSGPDRPDRHFGSQVAASIIRSHQTDRTLAAGAGRCKASRLGFAVALHHGGVYTPDGLVLLVRVLEHRFQPNPESPGDLEGDLEGWRVL